MPTNTNADPRSFMYYKEDYYINGTEIMLSDDYIKHHKFNGLKLWKYARFHKKIMNGSQVTYFFTRSKYSYYDMLNMGYQTPEDIRKCKEDYTGYFTLTPLELNYAIEEITQPIKLSQKEKEAINNAIIEMIDGHNKDWDYPELRILWIIYVVAMVGSLIFNHFYILWGIISVAFFKLRKGILEK